ncbi:MAG: TatD family hydrolase [Bacilli bacterium]|nr:TatD family hydrolase [Bacilli bacterium]
MIIDTHCHLFMEEYEDLYLLIQNLEKENIIAIVNGYDYKTSMEAYDLSTKHKNIYCALGIHPNNIMDSQKEKDYLFEKIINNKKVLAIGEIGLDYYHNDSNKEDQIKEFKKQIEYAVKYKKPIIVHTRDSIQDVYDVLSKYNVKGIIHAYSGSAEMAKRFINIGYKIGIGGVLTFKNSNLSEVVKQIGLENIVLETDSPYLTPHPYRGEQNSPIYLKIVIKKLSEIFNITEKEVIEKTYSNCLSLFDLE